VDDHLWLVLGEQLEECIEIGNIGLREVGRKDAVTL
jgi:hypothetical protein